DVTTKAEAEAAGHASAAASAGLRKNGHWRRERIKSELACRAFEENAARFHGEWRHGIKLRTRRIEGTRASEAGNADFPFDFRVVRLEAGVGDGPVNKCPARDRAGFTSFDENEFGERPEISW